MMNYSRFITVPQSMGINEIKFFLNLRQMLWVLNTIQSCHTAVCMHFFLAISGM